MIVDPRAETATTSASKAPFSTESTRRILDLACEQLGMVATSASLIRLGENALFRLAAAPVVVRIARPGYWADAEKEVAVAGWLAQHGVGAANLAEVHPQPVSCDGHPVTAWKFIDGRPGTLEDVGVLARVLLKFHSLPGPTAYQLPLLDPLERIEPRISAAPVPAEDKRFLAGLCAQLREQWQELDFPLPQGVVHGDAHVQNLMIAGERPVLIDFERVAWGQPEWDLAKTATEFELAGFYTSDQYQEFVDAYGFDVTTWPGFPVLRSAVGLGMTTWLMQNVQHDATIAAEYRKRVLTLRGRSSEQWKPF